MLYRESLNKTLTGKVKQSIIKRKDKTIMQTELYERYGIPETISSDYLSSRKPFEECDDFLMYAFTSVLCGKTIMSKHFSEKEIAHFKDQKFEEKTLKFPIVYKMIQVKDNQWIGKITVKDLVQLSKAQYIHYNENTQRTLKRVISEGVEYYKISLNKKAVEEIRQSLETGSFVPNTLTFNIPIDKADFDYNDKTCEFTINSMDYMDIIDGYHRYVAAIEQSSLNPEFDYDMEIRFVCFSEEDAKKFIFQEDQKTKMSRIDSESFNQNDYGNKIVSMVNSNSKCMLNGKINTGSDQIINAPELSRVVNEVYLSKGKISSAQIIQNSEKIVKAINQLVSEDVSLLETRWKFGFIVSAIYCLKENKYDLSTVNALVELIKPEASRLLYNKHVKNPSLKRIEELYKSI